MSIIHEWLLTYDTADQAYFDIKIRFLLPLLVLLLAQATAIVLTEPHSNTRLYRDVGGVVASPDVDAHLEIYLKLARLRQWMNHEAMR